MNKIAFYTGYMSKEALRGGRGFSRAIGGRHVPGARRVKQLLNLGAQEGAQKAQESAALTAAALAKKEKVARQPAIIEKILVDVPSVAALVGIPLAGGYAAGRLAGNWGEPTREDLDLIQAEYVRSKMEQAITDLENKKKIESFKEQHGADPNTLRI